MFCLLQSEDLGNSGQALRKASDGLTSLRFDEKSLEHLTNPNHETLMEMGKLRIVAWEASGPRPKMAPQVGDMWIDSHDDHAHHWIVKEKDRIVAAARMCIHASLCHLPDHEDLVNCQASLLWPVASMNRLVIHPEFRKKGLPKLFDMARVIRATQLDAKCVVVCVHAEQRKRVLEDLGFKAVAEATERAVPHAPTVALMKLLK